jgi:cyclic pyranopterin phosphate synthase
LVTAIIAGTSAVKLTSHLIPFCHPLPLDNCRIVIDFVSHPHPLGESALKIECTVSCTAKTGVEMEALTGASVAALTCYDMLKAISHDLVITETKLVKKTGGKSDYLLTNKAEESKN